MASSRPYEKLRYYALVSIILGHRAFDERCRAAVVLMMGRSMKRPAVLCEEMGGQKRFLGEEREVSYFGRFY